MISVIIPVKDGGDDLARCLDSIVRQRTKADVELIVVDSGSEDSSVELARSHGAEVLTVDPGAFRHGAARNLAAGHAKGDFLVFTTQDAAAETERWLELLCEPLLTTPNVAAVYGRQIAHASASPPERFFLDFVYGARPRMQVVARAADLSLQNTLFSNVNSAIRQSVWEEFSFADDVFFGEDQDWARRVLEAGYSIQYEPRAAVRHSHAYTLGGAFRRFFDTGASGERGFLAGPGSSRHLLRQAMTYAGEEVRWLARTRQLHWLPYTTAYELAKFAGLQLGAHHRRLPARLKRRWSTVPGAWE